MIHHPSINPYTTSIHQIHNPSYAFITAFIYGSYMYSTYLSFAVHFENNRSTAIVVYVLFTWQRVWLCASYDKHYHSY